jgi:hypothetical protein
MHTIKIAYSLLKIERLRANIKFTLHKALIRSIIIYACTAWEFAVDNHLLKLHRLRNKVLRTTGIIPRRKPVRGVYMACKLPHIYDYITTLCMQQAEVMQNHKKENVRNIGQGDARQTKCMTPKLRGGETYDRLTD